MALHTATRPAPASEAPASRHRPGVPQGEALGTWLLAAFLIVAGGITYARLDPVTIHQDVSMHGVAGGLSRVVMAANFPVALIAIGVVLVALDALPGRAWWIGAPAIALCAAAAWPGVVNEHDWDARAVNAVPAAGVVLALALTAAAAVRTGPGLAQRRWADPGRAVVALVVTLASLPWIVGQLGFYFPNGIFLTDHLVAESGGKLWPAVHVGYHHGFGGTLFVLSALLLSRARLRPGRRATATVLYLSLMFGYGLVNLAQDFWGEQIVKRGWTHWEIPSAINPRLHVIWLVILAITAGTAWLLRDERRRDGLPG